MATTHTASHLLHECINGMDPFTNEVDSLPIDIMSSPCALKAKASNDPDLPNERTALQGPDSDKYFCAMDKEIKCLQDMGTWEVVRRCDMPSDTKTIPGCWSFRCKRYPDGRIQKYKARFCVRGDLMEKGVHFDNTYSPAVLWSTIRTMLCFASSLNLHSRSIDFQNAFCQAEQKTPLYIELR